MERPLRETDWIQYEIADKLNQVDTDPEDRPFQSKYEAREIWSILRSKLLKYLDDIENNSGYDGYDVTICESAVATLSYEIARNFAATEERPAAETMAKEALDRLTQKGLKDTNGLEKEFISAKIALRNALGCIYCERTDPEAAVSCLREAERLYVDYVKSQSDTKSVSPPWDMKRPVRWVCGILEDVNDRFALNEDEWSPFEQLHTYTLYYLAQACKQNGELTAAAKYCQETLVRQLKSGKYDPIEWSLNTATLAVYYMDKGSENAFFRARRCLAAASLVIGSSKMDESTRDKRSRTVADIDRCWAKYGLALLEESHQRMLRNVDLSNNESNGRQEAAKEIPFDDIPGTDDFPAYLSEVEKAETEMTAGFVRTFPEAREVFLRVQRHLTTAQSSYYTLNDHATDYTELVQDSSRAYKALAAFESDIDRTCKMHKRRIDALEAVYKELSPTYYLAIRRQIAFELGEIYNEMLDLKIEVADEKNKGMPNAHQIAKINTLARSGIKYFQEFLISFAKDDDRGELKNNSDMAATIKYDPGDVRPIVLARFYCARLCSKILTGDMREKLVNCDASLREYRWIVDYIDRVDPAAIDSVKSEYDVCKDMVTLLPRKMDRMREAMV